MNDKSDYIIPSVEKPISPTTLLQLDLHNTKKYVVRLEEELAKWKQQDAFWTEEHERMNDIVAKNRMEIWNLNNELKSVKRLNSVESLLNLIALVFAFILGLIVGNI